MPENFIAERGLMFRVRQVHPDKWKKLETENPHYYGPVNVTGWMQSCLWVLMHLKHLGLDVFGMLEYLEPTIPPSMDIQPNMVPADLKVHKCVEITCPEGIVTKLEVFEVGQKLKTMAPAAALSIAQGSGCGIVRTERTKQHGGPYPLVDSKQRTKAMATPNAELWQDLDDLAIPPSMYAWHTALQTVIKNPKRVHPNALKISYFFPHPALFVRGDSSEHRLRYLRNWLGSWAGWITHLTTTDVSPIIPCTWRAFLNTIPEQISSTFSGNEVHEATNLFGLELVKVQYEVPSHIQFRDITLSLTDLGTIDPTMKSKILWDLYEHYFDHMLVPSLWSSQQPDWLDQVHQIFPGDLELTIKNEGLGSHELQTKLKFMERLRTLVTSRPGFPSNLEEPLLPSTLVTCVWAVEKKVVLFYVQSFFDYFSHPPIVPPHIPNNSHTIYSLDNRIIPSLSSMLPPPVFQMSFHQPKHITRQHTSMPAIPDSLSSTGHLVDHQSVDPLHCAPGTANLYLPVERLLTLPGHCTFTQPPRDPSGFHAFSASAGSSIPPPKIFMYPEDEPPSDSLMDHLHNSQKKVRQWQQWSSTTIPSLIKPYLAYWQQSRHFQDAVNYELPQCNCSKTVDLMPGQAALHAHSSKHFSMDESLEVYLGGMGYKVDTKGGIQQRFGNAYYWYCILEISLEEYIQQHLQGSAPSPPGLCPAPSLFQDPSKRRSGLQDDPVTPTATVFLSQEEIDSVECEVDSLRKKKPSVHRRGGYASKSNHRDEENGFEQGMKIPISVLNNCNKSFTAADEKHQKVHHHDAKSLTGLGQWLLQWWNHCQAKKASGIRGLRKCGVDILTLQAEWVAQVAVQTKETPHKLIADNHCHSAKATENIILQIMATQKSLENYETRLEELEKDLLHECQQRIRCFKQVLQKQKATLGVNGLADLATLQSNSYLQMAALIQQGKAPQGSIAPVLIPRDALFKHGHQLPS
ncbi:hypothetical protein F5141DRAFT_1064026 [Pisolithus sp. B1]|nr:hypothetical protein F5141DRAFT_1064026 [Pisolithus sp. B1]